ncbi:GNAT family N-acetyltransferase [Dysgonomonas sp. 25]|uniref:GNAT family N-acetyltransferase n=1 Tax=Dysgonomonas sp. 25 TaxID=2302933 RepID=UPI0013D77B12|nr:GNAT family N-acetyltransferase [Dysgonomonas sp. 25]NDV67519.1 N-acetyltransferase [Dysgonomonas sp. 25]
MLLSNSYIKLRALEPDDLDMLYQWENTSAHWLHGNTLAPYSRFALKKYITETQLTDIYESKQLRLMIELTDNNLNITIGIIDLYDLDVRNNRAGVGILIDEKYRNRGYATQSLDLIKDYAFNFLGLYQLYAFISVKNKYSLQLFENAGYKHAGILKNWILKNDIYEDVQILQLLKEREL